jgi:hypothetical protein
MTCGFSVVAVTLTLSKPSLRYDVLATHEFSFEPEDALLGLHVDVERAEYALPLGVDVLHDVERLLVDRDADPAEQLRLVQRRRELVRGCLLCTT